MSEENTVVVTKTEPVASAQDQMEQTVKNMVITPPTGRMDVNGPAPSLAEELYPDRNMVVSEGFTTIPQTNGVKKVWDLAEEEVKRIHGVIDNWFEDHFDVNMISGELHDAAQRERTRIEFAIMELKRKIGL